MAYPPSTTYRSGSLTEAQYNADNEGLANAMSPENINDASATVPDMQATTNPGGVGTESLATDLLGEIKRIRYMIKLITGAAQWYVDPGLTLSASQFAAGTKMPFHQTSAPTGWTKITSTGYNDSALRVVSGSVSAPGTVNPTRSGFLATVMAQTAVGATTLSTSKIPAHTHSVAIATTGGGSTPEATGSGTGSITTGSAGGGGSHDHSISLDIKYVDVIIAGKS